jgi:UDP-N-acetylglucosamine 2-epimerase (non-hydrolysing)
MPEEINRVLADHSSDYLFAPTEKSRQILVGEGVAEEKIFVTGNTVVDAVFQNLELCKNKRNVLDDLGLDSGDYILVTVHRQGNVDDEGRLRGIVEGLEKTSELGFEVVYPVHPRARKRLRAFGLEPNGVRLVNALDYLSFLQLERGARLVLTDSGGVQEEACILGVPCVTLRDNTERPETVDVGANVLAGTSPSGIVEKTRLMLNRDGGWVNPFGDGTAGEQIVQLLMKKFA